MKICICSSMAFSTQFLELKKELEAVGHIVLAPNDGVSYGEKENLPPTHEVWKMKGIAILAHFRKIDESDCILVTNYAKKGVENYIGGNTFLEMGYAYGTGKTIYLLNDFLQTSTFKEEMYGMQPTVLHGDISKIPV